MLDTDIWIEILRKKNGSVGMAEEPECRAVNFGDRGH
jgi:hypothetical protein